MARSVYLLVVARKRNTISACTSCIRELAVSIGFQERNTLRYTSVLRCLHNTTTKLVTLFLLHRNNYLQFQEVPDAQVATCRVGLSKRVKARIFSETEEKQRLRTKGCPPIGNQSVGAGT
jgi:hypothetical protein